MSILFANICWMRFYRGVGWHGDAAEGGGKYIAANGEGAEQYNFGPLYLEGQKPTCFGFFEPGRVGGTEKRLNLTRLRGYMDLEKTLDTDGSPASVKGVLAVFCAKDPLIQAVDSTRVVGWYKDAEVYAWPRDYLVQTPWGDEYGLYYNARSLAENCVLLPEKERHQDRWMVPRAHGSDWGVGFGQANYWYAANETRNPRLESFLERLADSIAVYQGPNWVCDGWIEEQLDD